MSVEMRAKHRAWKREAVKPLHAFANGKDWCGDFERMAMKPAGLPFRESHKYESVGYRIVGEDTEEAFERWRERAGRHLHGLARRYGLINTYGRVIYEAGFTTGAPQLRTVRVTIAYEHTVEVEEGSEFVPDTWAIRSDLRNLPEESFTVTVEPVSTEGGFR